MPMRKRKHRAAIQNLGKYVKRKKASQAETVPTALSSGSGTLQQPPTFLETYESAQTRISDLGHHREQVLAEISQPAAVTNLPRTEDSKPESADENESTVADSHTPDDPLTPPNESRHSQTESPKVLGKRKGTAKWSPSVGASSSSHTTEAREEVGDSEPLTAQRRQISDFGEGLIQAGNILKEKPCTADQAWVSDVLGRANLPVFAAELHAVLTPHTLHAA